MLKGKMTTVKNKEQRERDWIQTHTLSQEKFKKLVDEKFKRAYNQHHALVKRGMLVLTDRR
jgi:hypothetical protein